MYCKRPMVASTIQTIPTITPEQWKELRRITPWRFLLRAIVQRIIGFLSPRLTASQRNSRRHCTTAAFTGALTMRKTGAVGLGAWSASELVRDGLTAYRAEDRSVRWKYTAGAAADAVMLGGFGSRLLPSNKYGLAVAGAGFVTRWAIEKFM